MRASVSRSRSSLGKVGIEEYGRVLIHTASCAPDVCRKWSGLTVVALVLLLGAMLAMVLVGMMGCVCLVVLSDWLVDRAARSKAGVDVVDNGLDDIICRGGDTMRIDLRVSDRENIWTAYTTTGDNESECILEQQFERKLDEQTMTTRTARSANGNGGIAHG